MSADLVEFLNARLDERAEVAEKARRMAKRWPKAVHPSWIRARFEAETLGPRGVAMQRFEGRETPEEVIVDVVAKRAIVDRYQRLYEGWVERGETDLEVAEDEVRRILRHLALPFAPHPDYDPAWSLTSVSERE